MYTLLDLTVSCIAFRGVPQLSTPFRLCTLLDLTFNLSGKYPYSCLSFHYIYVVFCHGMRRPDRQYC